MSSGPKLILCPYCGHTQTAPDRCEKCSGLFESLSRKATQIKMGPWFIRDKNNPFRPGCSYDVLRKQINLGKIKPTTIIRGPSTYQFWSIARNVPGVAHLLGYCHRCSAHTKPNRVACPDCSEPFMPVEERNELGLMYRSEASLELAKRNLDQEQADRSGAGMKVAGSQAPSDSVARAEGSKDPSNDTIGGLSFDFSDESTEDVNLTQPGQTAPGLEYVGERPGTRPPDSTTPRDVLRPGDRRPSQGDPTDRSEASVDWSSTYSRSDDSAIQALRAKSKRLGTMVILLLFINLVTLVIWFPKIIGDSWSSFDLWALVDARRDTTSPRAQRRSPVSTNQLDVNDIFGDETADDLTSQAPDMEDPVEVLDPGNTESVIIEKLPQDLLDTNLAAKLADADRLMKEGKPKQALSVLENIARTVPPDQRPVGLDRAIQRLEEQIAHVESASFFGIPVK